jgi:hypothetical protein
MAISVNDQRDKNNEAGDSENDDDGLVTPHPAYKIGNVRTHIFPTYTIFIEYETHDQAPVIFAVAASFSSHFTTSRRSLRHRERAACARRIRAQETGEIGSATPEQERREDRDDSGNLPALMIQEDLRLRRKNRLQ